MWHLRHEDAEPLDLFVGHRLRQLELPALLHGRLLVVEDATDEVLAIVLGPLVVEGQCGVVLGGAGGGGCRARRGVAGSGGGPNG
jgi:hypothetical protein